MPVTLAAIGMGANLPSAWGEPETTVAEAVQRLGELGEVVAVSPLFRTEPVGVRDQPWFVNGAVLLRTSLAPTVLLQRLLDMEREAGRVRGERVVPKGPRVLDLDLLLVDDVVISSEELTLPHPALHERLFVLAPLERIAPDMRHPVLGKTIHQLWEELEDRGQIEQTLEMRGPDRPAGERRRRPL